MECKHLQESQWFSLLTMFSALLGNPMQRSKRKLCSYIIFITCIHLRKCLKSQVHFFRCITSDSCYFCGSHVCIWKYNFILIYIRALVSIYSNTSVILWFTCVKHISVHKALAKFIIEVLNKQTKKPLTIDLQWLTAGFQYPQKRLSTSWTKTGGYKLS